MTTTTASELRKHLSDFIGRSQYGGERITVTQHGKPVAALISYEDLELLRAIEDRLDQTAAEEAIRESEEHGYIDWDDFKSELAP